MTSVQVQHHVNEDVTMGVKALVIALAVISVALRFYTRIFTCAGLKADDWLILSAVVATLLTAVLLLWGNAISPAGLWASASENTDPNYVYTPEDIFHMKLAFVIPVLYFTISGATKLGILFMYHRIFAVSTAFRYLTFTAGGLVIGWWVGCTVATLTSCVPLEWTWINSPGDPRYCFSYNIFWMASGACEIFLDVLILSLPITVVVTIRLSLEQKLTVSGIFLLGGFVIITGLVKVILGYSPGQQVPSYASTEVWTSVHTGMAIVCSNLPIFKPLINRISRSRFVTKISNVLPLRRSAENLRSSPNRMILGPGGGGRSNDQIRISPLVTIGGTPMYDSYFSRPGTAYLGGGGVVCSTKRREPAPERYGEENDQELFLELPDINLLKGMELPSLHS